MESTFMHTASVGGSTYTAFAGGRRIASGTLSGVAVAVRSFLDAASEQASLTFDDATGAVVDLDLRGTADEIAARFADTAPSAAEPAPDEPRRPGRPKLGVIAREVTLLPRHWEWLNAQPGGASVALRKLVEEARKANEAKDRIRRAREAAYRFMSAMAGNEAGFEEAARALFRGNRDGFQQHSRPWPEDIRDYARLLAEDGFGPEDQPENEPSSAQSV